MNNDGLFTVALMCSIGASVFSIASARIAATTPNPKFVFCKLCKREWVLWFTPKGQPTLNFHAVEAEITNHGCQATESGSETKR